MTLKIPYSNREFEDILNWLRQRVPEITDQWTDFLDSDPGYALLKTFAAIGDFNSFYLDRQAAESYIVTAEQRENIVAMAKSLGYEPHGYTTASTTVEFTLQAPYFETIHIPAGTALTIEGKSFFTVSEVVITAGTTSGSTTVKQGSPYNVTITGSGVAYAKTIHPKRLTDVVVEVNNVLWTRISSFVFNDGVVQCYRLYEDRDNNVVMFGGGYRSAIPAFGDSIRVTGTITDGIKGNTTLQQAPVTIVTPIYNSLSQNVVNLIAGRTLSAASGGADPETMESIRRNAPAFYTTQNRAVTASDYEAIANAVPGVEEAFAWGGEEVGRYGEVFVCVAGSDRSNVPDSLLTSVQNALAPKHMIPIIVHVVRPELVRIDITCSVFAKGTYDLFAAKNSAIVRVTQYFEETGIGQILQASDLTAKIAIDEIDYVNVSLVPYITGHVEAGRLFAVMINHYVQESLEVYSSDLSTLLWKYGDSPFSEINGRFEVDLPGQPDGPLVVKVQSKYPDIYVIRQQAISLGTLYVNSYRTNKPL